MPDAAIHPRRDVLRALAAGVLDDDAVESVVGHVDSCLRCQTELASLSVDSFLAKVRAADTPRHDTASTGLSPQANTVTPGPGAATGAADIPPELRGLKHYDVLRELGRGGMGVVYLARNTVMEREEALKVINPGLLESKDGAERFLREVRAAARLNHGNIVSAHAAFEAGSLLVFAMEYVAGDNLASVVKAHGPLPIAHACGYVRQVAQGLHHAHEKGMVHRDIKPGNLMLVRQNGRDTVKILDFGLAKVRQAERSGHDLTDSNRMLGTPAFMAPEQAVDAAGADMRADIYSLGCTLYYLLTGRAPFVATSAIGLALAHASAEAVPVHELRPDAPAELSAVIAIMMAKDPAQRHQTPLEVVAALEPFAQPGSNAWPMPRAEPCEVGANGSYRHTGVQARLPQTKPRVAPLEPFRSPPVDRPSPTRWRRHVVAGGVALGVLVLGLVIALVTSRLVSPPGDATIVLKNVPPDAVVIIDGNKVSVEFKGDGKPLEIRVVPGKHALEVHCAGFKTWASNITVAAGERRERSVMLDPRNPNPSQ